MGKTALGITTLLRESYIKHYPVTSGALMAFNEVRRRRNFVHFAEPYVWGVDRNLLDLVDHLNRAIPLVATHRRSRRRAAAPNSR